MGARCTVDIMGYCLCPAVVSSANYDPGYHDTRGVKIRNPNRNAGCRFNPASCEYFRTWTQECERLSPGSTARTPTPASPGKA